MPENTGNKNRAASQSAPRRRSPSSRPGGGGAPKNRHPANQPADKPTGKQITIDEVMDDNDEQESEPAPKRTKKVSLEKDGESPVEKPQENETKEPPASEISPEIIEQISWKKQMSSIVIWMFSVILLSLTFFPGESLWTIIHSTILGIFGFKAFLWAALLIFLGYLMTKQINDDDILNIIRPAAGIILLSDVLGYILIQSNGYRNVYNEMSFGFFQLFSQIFRDGEKIGGTGLLGGTIGELLMFFAGKNGAAIITTVLLLALIMVISRTGPLDLLEQGKTFVKSLMNPAFYKELFSTSDEAISYSDLGEDGSAYDTDAAADEAPDPEELPHKSPVDQEDGAETSDSEHDRSLDEIVKKVSLKKSRKLTKAEEIKAQSEAFSRQVETVGTNAGETDEKDYKYPPIRLLIPSKNTNSADDRRELTETADMLIRTLEEYGVKASISDISRGPTVTRYEINPAPGVKINKIKNLSDDIALRLAAQSIRIEAPIPGKAAVGIEIPNLNKQMVRIREILGSREFAEAKGALTVALGKDIEGNIVLCDLSKMPHLLIAGSTGSGKSVCVNSMLMSILYKYSPEQVRMVLIDPKSVEFDMYNGIPHLLVPVVCEPKKAAGALQWAVSEMLKRYGMLKEHGARNIDNYNRLAEQTGEFEKLCRIVIVIDEMADLMIASPKEVEDAIARLAAMARAAGMYMVLATQRPSVDVITGTIKNNIPSRIALAVSSQVDSRTILDEGGAENLIGYGDMLYHPMGSSKHIRVQGCFVDDMEVERVIRFVMQNGHAEYDDSIADEIERNSLDSSGDNSAEFEGKDEFFEKAVEVVTEAGQASTSMLQRRLGVGYARAGRIIDQLEEHGIIGPHEGSKPRAVLITRTQWLEMTMSRTHAGKNDPIVRSHSEFAAQTLDNGHEEITARQSEFFNAALEDEEEDEDFMGSFDGHETDGGMKTEAGEIQVDVEDSTPAPVRTGSKPARRIRDFTQFFEDEESEPNERVGDIFIEKLPDVTASPTPEYSFREQAVSVHAASETPRQPPSDAPLPRGTEKPVEDIPPWEDAAFAFIDEADTTPQEEIPSEEPIHDDVDVTLQEGIPSEEPTHDDVDVTPQEEIPSEEPTHDDIDVTPQEEIPPEEPTNDDEEATPQEEIPSEEPIHDAEETAPQEKKTSAEPTHDAEETAPQEKKTSAEPTHDEEDDDFDDDILSSSWIKKL